MEWGLPRIGDFGGDPANVTLSGHSAGAHLGAGILAHDWKARGVDGAALRGATLISGIYDPAPARLTSINAQLKLTDEIIGRHNIERPPPLLQCPVAVVAGGLEPWQWIDQSFRYFHHLHRSGLRPELHVLSGRNHFDILDEYLTPDSLILRSILGQARAGGVRK